MTNEIENLEITGLDIYARGIGHDNGKTIFVQNAITGERVDAIKTGENKNYSSGVSTKILVPSENRVVPLCPYFSICGGCDTQHLCYDYSLEFKKEQIKLAFQKISNEKLDFDLEIVPSEKEYFYRNKIALSIKNVDNEKVLCMFKKNSHLPIKIESCAICNEKFKILISAFNNFLKTLPFCAYNEKTKKGELKHVVARIIDDKILVTICTSKKIKLDVTTLFCELSKHFKEVGINQNINKLDYEILSNNFVQLKGIEKIEFENMGVVDTISNASFLQVNSFVAQKLYSYVLSKLSSTTVNAYSGSGLLTVKIAQKLYEIYGKNSSNPSSVVYGIEINPDACALANKLKEKYNLSNIKNFQGDANDVLKKLNLTNYTLIVDPPKSGLDENMIKTIIETKPQKIVYISCGKTSLCKNYSHLKSLYEIEEIKIFDMFPQTINCETVATLKLKNV